MLSQLLYEWSHYIIFQDRLFRAGASALFSILLVFFLCSKLIKLSNKYDLSSDFNKNYSPPIMGGMILVPSIVVSSFLFTKINSYVISIIFIMSTFFIVGCLDDLAKIYNKRKVNKGLLTKEEYQDKADGISARFRLFLYFLLSFIVSIFSYKYIPNLTGELNLIFIKPDIWAPYLPNWIFIPFICLVITTIANGANFTDGMDSLVSIPLITCSLFVGIAAYVSGNSVLADYFLIPHYKGLDELFPICTAIIGSLIAYLWYNAPPAQIYMGDSGSIGLGGALGVMFILTNTELFIPIVGFIFVVQVICVFLQILYFKLTRTFSSNHQGRRMFYKAPYHHHLQISGHKKGLSIEKINSKIIWHFHIISAVSLIIGLILFLKVR